LLQCDNSFSFIHFAHTGWHSFLLAQFFTLSVQLSSFFFVLSDVFGDFSIVLVDWRLIGARFLCCLGTHHLSLFSCKDNYLRIDWPLVPYVRVGPSVELCQIRCSQCRLSLTSFISAGIIIWRTCLNLLRACHSTSTSVIFAKCKFCGWFRIVARTVLRSKVLLACSSGCSIVACCRWTRKTTTSRGC